MQNPVPNLNEPFQEFLHQKALAFTNHLLDGMRLEAAKIIHDLVNAGITIPDIYQFVIKQGFNFVNQLYITNRIGIAKIHHFSAFAQVIMSELYPIMFKTPKKGLSLIAAPVPGELHIIGVRMVADVFQLNGWDTRLLTPLKTKDFIDVVDSARPNLIALSVTVTFRIRTTADLVSQIKKRVTCPVIVGGAAFILGQSQALSIGADLFAPDPQSALKNANNYLKVEQ